MSKDHLDNETSISAALTDNGIKASAKSRTISAIDRLGGNLVELLNTPIEERVSRKRAQISGERQIIEAAAQQVIERLKVHPEFAQRAFESHFQRLFKAQENKDAVLMHMLEDLRAAPPREENGRSELDPQFTARVERHAEEASTEAMRERWGRVLAAEIREPGTFSSRAIRVVDELAPETAKLFEKFCESRLGNVVPRCLAGELPFTDCTALVSADFIVDPGISGQIAVFQQRENSGEWWRRFGSGVIMFSNKAAIPGDSDVLKLDKNKPVCPVYVLTDVGFAIATILQDLEIQALAKLIEKLLIVLRSPISEYQPHGTQFILKSIHHPSAE